MNNEKFNQIKRKHSKWGSWAIWSDDNRKDTELISQNINILHSNFVIVGLNVSEPITADWVNFHSNGHCRKLCIAFNKHEKIRGAYMTDLFKMVGKDSKKINSWLKENHSTQSSEIIKQKEHFLQELEDVGADENTVFLLLGKIVQKYFSLITDGKYNLIINLRHYSDFRIKDEEWVNNTLTSINS